MMLEPTQMVMYPLKIIGHVSDAYAGAAVLNIPHGRPSSSEKTRPEGAKGKNGGKEEKRRRSDYTFILRSTSALTADDLTSQENVHRGSKEGDKDGSDIEHEARKDDPLVTEPIHEETTYNDADNHPYRGSRA
jgi:hypothetical protein